MGDDEDITIEERGRLWAHVISRCLFDLPDDRQEQLARAIDGVEEPYKSVGLALLSNMRRVASVATLPFLMAASAVENRRFMSILSAERIRRIPIDESLKLSDKDEEQALSAAHQILSDTREGDAKRNFPRQATEILAELGQHFRSEAFGDAADDLLRQTIASIWGAFELFTNEIVLTSLNAIPALALQITSKAPAKRHFQGRSPTLEELAQKNFDVSAAMGDILLSERSLTSLEAIRDVFNVLVPVNASLHILLHDRLLWILWQQRHVVVHRRGIVDRTYYERTGDTNQLVGRLLCVNRDDVYKAFNTIQAVAIEILSAVPFLV